MSSILSVNLYLMLQYRVPLDILYHSILIGTLEMSRFLQTLSIEYQTSTERDR